MAVGTNDTPKSLSREFPAERTITVIASLTAGAGVDEIVAAFRDADVESSTSWVSSLLIFQDGGLVEDELVRTCKRAARRDAKLLLWVARLWSESRLATVVETILTGADGKLNESNFRTAPIVQYFESVGITTSAQKSASNVLRQMAECGIYEPLTSGSAIVGVDHALPTSSVVPRVVRFVNERAENKLAISLPPGLDAVTLAVALSANKWVNLTVAEFCAAATGSENTRIPIPARQSLPPELEVIHEELIRRGQIVLQGAPGVGKTFFAMQYIDWASVNRRDESHVGRILQDLPVHERTPERVAEVSVHAGITCLWDIAQFHPSYTYEDFVRALVPYPLATGISFRAEHRRLSFMAAVGEALLRRGSSCSVVLIIDEINRADIARVFGELLFALEYRDQPVGTPYAVADSNALLLPRNLLLVGTMNTADRSIALIDYALRRRFTFIDLAPDRDVVAHADWYSEKAKSAALLLYDSVSALFQGGPSDVAALAVGHSYFLPSGTPINESEALGVIARRFAYEVVPLLREYTAEGIIDESALNLLLLELQVDPDSITQSSVEEQLVLWMLNT